MTTGTLIELAHASLHVVDEGSGPPVVFMHGWSYDHHLWDEVAPAVTAMDRRAIRFDQRGHGRSPVTAPFPFEVLVEDLDELLSTLAIDRPVLCGLSLGGFVAMGYAISRPKAVAGLILADTCSRPIARDREMAETIPGTAAGVQALSQWWEAGRPVTQDRDAFEQKRTRFLRNSADGLRNAIAACAGRSPVTDRLGEIKAPTLVVVGENDQFFSPAMHADLAAQIPDARLTVLPEAGHISCLDQPAAFITAVTDFLSTIPPHKETEDD